MNFFGIIKGVLSKPGEFFEQVGKGKERLGFAFGFYALFGLISLILGYLGSLLVSLLFTNLTGDFASNDLLYTSLSGIYLALWYPFMLGLSFVFAGISHLIIKMFGGSNTYTKTYELAIYSNTPSLIFGWIPFIGSLFGVWSIVLFVIGTHKTHNLSVGKSIGVLAVHIALILLVLFMILAMVFAIGAAAFSSLAGNAFGGLI